VHNWAECIACWASLRNIPVPPWLGGCPEAQWSDLGRVHTGDRRAGSALPACRVPQPGTRKVPRRGYFEG
jgi:hypothetical protein